MSTTTFLARVDRIPRAEFVRKTLHISPGLLPFALVLIPHPNPLDLLALLVIVALTVVLTGVFLAWRSVVRRPGEVDFRSSTLSYPITIVLTLVLFPAHPEFAGVVVTIIAFGDGCAYFGGKLFGRRALPWNPEKTWAGSASFVICSAPVASLAYWCIARNPEPSFLTAFFCGTVAAVTGALAESLPLKITDNLRVGVAAAVAVVAAHFLVAERWAVSVGSSVAGTWVGLGPLAS